MIGTRSQIFKPGLATIIEENLMAYFTYRSQARQTGLYMGKEVVQFCTKIAYPSPYFNLVLHANFTTPESAHHHIYHIRSKAQLRNAPLFWLIGPSTRPYDLGTYLEIYQFSHSIRCAGMLITLDCLNTTHMAPSGLTIKQVRTPAQLRQFVTVLATGAGLPKTAIPAWFAHEVSLGTDPEAPLERYLGVWHGKPVAACATFSTAGVVGLHHLTTLPAMRGSGIRTALALAALRETGPFYQYGVSLAPSSETDLYRRLGFQTINEFNFYQLQGVSGQA